MLLDDEDIKVLKENFDEEIIEKVDMNNLKKIYIYLQNNGIYYAKDLIISSLDLFLLPVEQFIKQFEKLKMKIGNNYVERLAEDTSLIEIMYEE